MNPCLRPTQCTDRGFGPENCAECNPPHDDRFRLMLHDPKGSKEFPLRPGVCGDAMFGGERDEYRHWLQRCWGKNGDPFMLNIGMNPSTARHNVDDPTIRLDQDLCRRLGLTNLFKVNVMDYRATHPKDLLGVMASSGQNRVTIRDLAERAHIIVAGWGLIPSKLQRHSDNVLFDLKGKEIWCLGINKDRSPKHPLFVPKDTPLIRLR
jgi:hypothetical protein